MTIDTNALKNIARQIIAARDTTLQNDMESKKNYIRVQADSILKQLDAIRAVAPAFNALKSAKIDFIDTFFTDSYNRDIGFSIGRNNLIGICGGGVAQLQSVFVNFRNEKFIVCDVYHEDDLCIREIDIDELVEKYWNDDSVRRYLNRIANGQNSAAFTFTSVNIRVIELQLPLIFIRFIVVIQRHNSHWQLDQVNLFDL
jgi:hypothetical protein